MKKGVDKREETWYSNQAVGAAVPRRGEKCENLKNFKKRA